MTDISTQGEPAAIVFEVAQLYDEQWSAFVVSGTVKLNPDDLLYTSAPTIPEGWKLVRADEIERNRAVIAELVEVLTVTREILQGENDLQNGAIVDTIWRSPHETLFDFMDAAIAKHTGEKDA